MQPNSAPIIPINSDTAKRHPEFLPFRNGRVLSVSKDGILIEDEDATFYARKAFSCLVDPAPEDTVLTGNGYVLAILQRPASTQTTLTFPTDTTLQTRSGDLNFRTDHNLNLAGKNINQLSEQVVMRSKQAYLSLDTVTASGDELHASYKTVRVISHLITTLARQVIDKFKGYIRHTEDNDQVQAGQLTRRTDGLFSMDSRQTVMISKKDTKIDGEKIYMA